MASLGILALLVLFSELLKTQTSAPDQYEHHTQQRRSHVVPRTAPRTAPRSQAVPRHGQLRARPELATYPLERQVSTQREPISAATLPRQPLDFYADSICCLQRLSSDVENVDRRCSINGRFRRTSIRGPVLQTASAGTPTVRWPTFAEFGVEWAESADDFAPPLQKHTTPVTVHLYDNFEKGLPKAGKNDHKIALGRQGKFAGTMQNAIEKWQSFGFTPVCHKGLFTDSLLAQPVARDLIAVHSDGDLYVSVNQVLVLTYSHVVPEGAFVIDDWFGGKGAWESARKAVYDFAIHQDVAPNLRTPVVGASAYWIKLESDACPDCYRTTPIKSVNLNALTQVSIDRYKAKLQELQTAISGFAQCTPSGMPQASDDEVFAAIKTWQARAAKGVAFAACDGTGLFADPPSGTKINAVVIGKECTDADYDREITRWWSAMPQDAMMILECWDGSSADPVHGCRPAFYRFVSDQGIMPHLQTVYDHPTAFWIKGPMPLG